MTRKLTDKIIRQLHKRYMAGELQRDLAAEAGVHIKTITDSNRRLRLPKRKRKNPLCDNLTYDLDKAHERYISGEHPDIISVDCGITSRALVTRFKKRGLKTLPAICRPIKCPEAKNFNPVNQPEAAYWLGFLVADGCVQTRCHKYRTSYIISCTVARQDKQHVERLANYMGGKVYDYSGRSVMYKAHQSPDWSCLCQYGFGKRKAYRLVWPISLSNELLRHYVRGFFDGDGSMWTRTNLTETSMQASWTVYSVCEQFLSKMQKWLKKYNLRCLKYTQNIAPHKIDGRDVKGCTMHKLMICAHDDLIKLYDLLYNDANVYLERKKDKFELPIQYRANNIHNKMLQCNA